MVNHVAANVFGTMGTICWTGQLIPQIWKSWREKSTKGFSHWLMLLWGVASIFMGAYAFIQRLNIPLTLQPQLFGFLCLISWGQCQYYELNRSRRNAILMTCTVMILCGVVELVLVLTIRPIENPRSKDIATMFFGIMGTVLISVALLPQYYEIYKLRAVIGISLVFISIDMLGGLLNNLSLAFGEKFDVIAGVSYTLVIVLDGVIVICAAAFKLLAWKRARAARARQGRVNIDSEHRSVLDSRPPQPSPNIGHELGQSPSFAPVQHLTVLSRSGSRLSNTPSKYSWIVADNGETTTPQVPRPSSVDFDEDPKVLEDVDEPQQDQEVSQPEADHADPGRKPE